MSGRHYLTTSIPYVNAAPHLGHALEFVQADVFARYRRLQGADTRLQSGTDDNSLKNVLAAEQAGTPVRELVDGYATVFRGLEDALGVQYDDFIRTSADARHLVGVRRLWETIDRRGDIYKRHYEGLYCVGCEQFYTPDELLQGRCPDHGTLPETVREENYFFRLSRYQEPLQRLLASGRLRIIPAARRNEVLALVGRGLQDFSISRSRDRARGWGIEVPGDPRQVMYVWFDALANYITALGYGQPDGPPSGAPDGATDGSAAGSAAGGGDLYRRYWAEGTSKVHVIGKGILRFHAVYWPAMLLSAGEPLPDTIFVHGYLTVGGQKLSKSLGNGVDPRALVERYGADAVRYWLLRDVPPSADADYTAERLEGRYTADLANDLGNLLQRTVSMVQRYRQGEIPALPALPQEALPRGEVAAVATAAVAALHEALARYDPQSALGALWEVVARANRYVEETAPWTLARRAGAGEAGAGEQLDRVLVTLVEALRVVGEGLRPFLPGT
ncbi:MAG TPA: methionine--tRNA ligase, partial [Chloroflexota bacterium]|nr:methionine--tRNA ligase [Chloroflexota bacterium]